MTQVARPEPIELEIDDTLARIPSVERGLPRTLTEWLTTTDHKAIGVAYAVTAFVFLPKNARPPYQALVYHPSAGAQTSTFAGMEGFNRMEFIVLYEDSPL